MASEFIVHPTPAWKDRADFVIHAELPETDSPIRFEQLWARQRSDDEFEVCCIPFFVYDVALGDITRTKLKGDMRYVLDRVLVPSGRYVFRVWFDQERIPADQVAGDLTRQGALLEWSSAHLLAVDAPSEKAQDVADYLAERERRGELHYETGRTR